MNLLVWRCFENLVFIIKGKMRWSAEFRPANIRRRRGENRPRNIRQIPIYIFISQPCVGSEKSPSVVAKGKKVSFSHTRRVNEGALLKTADVSSRPRWRCVKASPPPGTRDHFRRQSFPMCHFHCTARSGLRRAPPDPPLLFIGFHHRNSAAHKRWLQMCLQLPWNRLCNDAPRRSDRVAKMWLPSSGWM